MLLRWTPWNHLEDIDPRVRSWAASRTPSPTPLEASDDDARDQAVWQPPVDLHEDAERLLLVVDLPGLEQADIDLTIEKNVLRLAGERQREVLGTRRQRTERPHGVCSRAFTLPATVDLDRVTAEMKAGVLRVTLPKKPKPTPRHIQINAAS